MSPGPNKRKSTKKKKKKAKPSKSSASTPEHSPDDGESDDGEFSSSTSNSQHTSPLPPVKLETSEDKKTDEKESKIEIDKRSQEKSLIPRSSSANKSRDKKKAVAIEPANSSPETVNHKTKRQQKNTKSPLKQTGVDENSSNLIHPKETGLAELVEKLVSVDEKASPKSKDCLTASTLNCPFCGRGGADRLKEHDTPECPEKYPLLSPNPFSQAPEKTSWKSCCGLFELCSGSSRSRSYHTRQGIEGRTSESS
ncbi:unnamed protein product [Lactuca saligna]|uniref:Uncharacterized protein n=1 Tax=Lactuca saligna TaxID=75948 RepID=A0AA36E1X1_LACSI|nr:unnamed protein product [Lactuca saligna]